MHRRRETTISERGVMENFNQCCAPDRSCDHAALFVALLLWNPSRLALWLKAFHVIAVIAWMAGMLYLPRLFVYHCERSRIEAIRNLQGHGAATAARDHQSGDDRDLGAGSWLAYDQGFFKPAGCTASCCWC
jgi:hypothetical protein